MRQDKCRLSQESTSGDFDSGRQRYTEWFGVYSSSRYNTVKNNFSAISNAMTNAGITFDCKCKQNY